MAIPGKVVEIVDEDKRLARVEVAGVDRRVTLSLLDDTDQAGPGDWVLVHVGLALSRISEAEALETLQILDEVTGAYDENSVVTQPDTSYLNLEATT